MVIFFSTKSYLLYLDTANYNIYDFHMHLQSHTKFFSLNKYLPQPAAISFPSGIEHTTIWATRGGSGGSSFSHPAEHPHCTAHLVPWRPSRIAIDSGSLDPPRQPPKLIPRFSGITPTNLPGLQRLPSYAPTQLTYDNLQLRSHTANLFLFLSLSLTVTARDLHGSFFFSTNPADT